MQIKGSAIRAWAGGGRGRGVTAMQEDKRKYEESTRGVTTGGPPGPYGSEKSTRNLEIDFHVLAETDVLCYLQYGPCPHSEDVTCTEKTLAVSYC